MGAKTYVKKTKTFTPNGYSQVTTTIYDSGKGLFVYQHPNKTYAIMTPCMGYIQNVSKKTLDENLDIMHKMLEILDWTTIQTTDDWQSLPQETIEKVKKAVYG